MKSERVRIGRKKQKEKKRGEGETSELNISKDHKEKYNFENPLKKHPDLLASPPVKQRREKEGNRGEGRGERGEGRGGGREEGEKGK